MIKPICRSTCPARNNFESNKVKSGVMIKFIVRAEREKRRSENDFEISLISMFRNRKKSMSIRKISIKLPALCSREGMNFPRSIPTKADRIIKRG
jgi:hypothetical protein